MTKPRNVSGCVALGFSIAASGSLAVVVAVFAFPLLDIERRGVGEGLRESRVEGAGVHLAHTYAVHRGNEGAEQFAVLARKVAHGRQFLVAFEFCAAAYLPANPLKFIPSVWGVVREPQPDDIARTEASVRREEFLCGALQPEPELHHRGRSVVQIHKRNS